MFNDSKHKNFLMIFKLKIGDLVIIWYLKIVVCDLLFDNRFNLIL